jgi:predicted nucleic acid-binding protein
MNFMSVEFIDSNVLVYAYDRSAGRKHEIARNLVMRLLAEMSGVLSLQVLAEFFVVATRKIAQPLPPATAAEIVRDMAAWKHHAPSAADLLFAMRLVESHRINLWDAMIIRSAVALNADVIWSEDLQHGQAYEGIPVKNPFRQ